MAKTYYVNIDNSYSNISNVGTIYNPYNWDEFLISVSSDTDIESKTYLLSGSRLVQSPSYVNLNILFVGAPQIYINAIDTYNPWKLHFSGVFANFSGDCNLDIQNGFIQNGTIMADTPYIRFKSNVEGSFFNLKNVWIKSHGHIQIFNYRYVIIQYCTLYIRQNLNPLPEDIQQVIMLQDTQGINVHNSYNFSDNIADVYDVRFANNGGTYSIQAQRNAFTRPLSAYYNGTLFDIENDYNWTPPNSISADISDINSSAINYLISGYNSISNYIDYMRIPGERGMYNSERDGIGALYFNDISNNILSASVSPGYIQPGSTVYFTISGNDPFVATSAYASYYMSDSTPPHSIANVTANDVVGYTFPTSSTPSTSVITIYLAVRPKNEWYILNRQLVYILSASSVLVNFIMLDSLTNTITSTMVDNSVRTKATVVSGDVYNLYFDFGNGIVETLYNSQSVPLVGSVSSSFNSYSLANRYNTVLYTNNLFQSSASFLVIPKPTSSYYVDITSAYDSNTGNTGTPWDAFNWSEFVARVSANGTGNYGDIYKLKGDRNLIVENFNNLPWIVFSADKDKNFRFEDWDVFAYGPWILSFQNYYASPPSFENSIISFEGSTIKNDIIYNKPYSNNKLAGKIKVTNILDAFILNQGNFGEIVLTPYRNVLLSNSAVYTDPTTLEESTYTIESWNNNISDCDLKGSTLYSDGVFGTNNTSSFNVNLYDNVIKNFSASTNLINCSATLVAYNNTFSNSQSSVNLIFKNIYPQVLGNNQYDWTSPSAINYPFHYSNNLYEKDYLTVFNKKSKIKPFTGISEPPNPGKNYPLYEDYETGLFGFTRKTYITSSGFNTMIGNNNIIYLHNEPSNLNNVGFQTLRKFPVYKGPYSESTTVDFFNTYPGNIISGTTETLGYITDGGKPNIINEFNDGNIPYGQWNFKIWANINSFEDNTKAYITCEVLKKTSGVEQSLFTTISPLLTEDITELNWYQTANPVTFNQNDALILRFRGYLNEISTLDSRIITIYYDSNNYKSKVLLPYDSTCVNISLFSNPSNTTVTAGDVANFSVSAGGTLPTYQWQVSTDGGSSYDDISGSDSNTYQFIATQGMDFYKYRCIVSNSCPSSAFSTVAVLTVVGGCIDYSKFLSQPVDTTVLSGTSASFSATVSGSIPLVTQWQLSTDDGLNWNNVTDGNKGKDTQYSTLANFVYTTTATSVLMNGYKYRGVSYMQYGACSLISAISNEVTLSISGIPICDNISILSQPSNSIISAGQSTIFNINVSGTSPTYQWQVSTDGGTNYTNVTSGSGATTSAYTTQYVSSIMNGYIYECIINNSCSSAISNPALLSVISAGSNIIIGRNIIGNVSGEGGLTYIDKLISQKVLLTQNATIQSLNFYIDSASSPTGQMTLGIYDANGLYNGPGSLIASTSSFNVVSGWNNQNVLTPVLLTSASYWLAYEYNDPSVRYYRFDSGNASWYTFTYASLPSPFSVFTNTAEYEWSYYAILST